MSRDSALRWAFLATSIWLCFFLDLGTAPLFDTEEGRFAAASLALLQSNEPMRAFADGQLLLEDAPLVHWLQALSLQYFGTNEAALRLPSAIAASLWLIAIYQFAAARMGRVSACYAVAFMSCSLAVVLIGRSATADALFNLWLTLCLFDLYRWCEGERRRHLFKAFMWAGLGVLTKGLLALLIPALLASVYLLSTRRWQDLLKTLFFWPGWLVLLAIALPWYAHQYSLHGSVFLRAFFLEGLVFQFTHTHSSSLLYYLYTLPLVVVPFSFVALLALWRAGQTWSTPFNRYMLCWFSVVLVSFSASGKIQPNHLLYGSTALFLLMAKFREDYNGRLLTLLPLLAFALLCAALPLLFKYYSPEQRLFDTELIAVGKTVLLDSSYWIAATLFLLLSLWLVIGKQFKPIEALALGGYIQTAFVATTLGTAVGIVQQGATQKAALIAKEAQAELVQWESNKPSLSFYREVPVPRQLPTKGQWVFVPVHKLDDLPALDVKFRSGGYLLAEALADSPPLSE